MILRITLFEVESHVYLGNIIVFKVRKSFILQWILLRLCEGDLNKFGVTGRAEGTQ